MNRKDILIGVICLVTGALIAMFIASVQNIKNNTDQVSIDHAAIIKANNECNVYSKQLSEDAREFFTWYMDSFEVQ